MLDRLSLSLISLPNSAYDTILILLDIDDTRTESQKLLNRDVLSRIVASLKPGGRLKSQDGRFASTDSKERREAILAGLVIEKDEMIKPSYEITQTVPLRLSKKSEPGVASVAPTNGTDAVPLNMNGKRGKGLSDTAQPVGVGFVDFSDDFDAPGEDSDDELIDENTLLDDDDLSRPIVQRRSFRISPSPPFLRSSIFLHQSNSLISTFLSPTNRKTPPCLQRLYLRSRATARSRRLR